MEKETKSKQMLNLYNSGMAIGDIAKKMGVRYNFVYNVVSTHCMKEGTEVRVGRKNGSVKAEIVKRLEQGMDLKEISKETGTLYNYCWKVRKEWEEAQAKKNA